MKMKWISTLSALAIVGTGCIAAVPAIINNQSNVSTQETDANQIVETNNIKHSKNVQVVNAVEEIVIEDIITRNMMSSAIVNNNGKQELYVWGSNAFGQLGLGDKLSRNNPILLESSKLGNYTSIKDFRIGDDNSAMIIVDTPIGEQIYVWGENSYGQLGLGHNSEELSPVLFDTTQFKDFTKIKHIEFGSTTNSDSSYNSYAILIDNNGNDKIYVWGHNLLGSLGLGDKTNRFLPTLFDTTQFGSYKNIKSLIISETSYAIIETDANVEKLFLWGRNNEGQCATGVIGNLLTPKQLISPIFDNAKIKFLVNGYLSFLMVLTKDGMDQLYSWGYNYYGQIGDGTTTNRLTVYKIPQSLFGGASEITKINSNLTTIVEVKLNGITKNYIWGENTRGSLGLGDNTQRNTPVLFDNSRLGNFIDIYDWSFDLSKYSNMLNHFAYVKTLTGDKLYTWGSNDFGQLGLGHTTSKNVPTEVTSINLLNAEIKDFSSWPASLILTLNRNGKTESYATGHNEKGQLGLGHNNNISIFTPVLPTRNTNPQQKEYHPTNLSSSQALDLINHNNILNKTEINNYVDLSAFPATATITIDPSKTTSDYENGILNLGIKTDQYYNVMQNAQVNTPKTFNVKIDGFRKVTSIQNNPVVTIQRYADDSNIDTIYEHIVNNSSEVIDRELLEYYFNLSSIPPHAVLHLYRTSFGNNMEAMFKFTSNQVYDSKGMVVNQEYTKPDLLLKLNSTSPEVVQAENADSLGLIISLSVVGALLLISLIVITVMLMKRKHY